MNVLDELQAQLASVHGIELVREPFDLWLIPKAPDGFQIIVRDERPPEDEWAVCVGDEGAATYGLSARDAIEYTRLLLSRRARLVVTTKRFSRRYVVEKFDGECWLAVRQSTVLPKILLGKIPKQMILQNRFLD